MNSDKQNKCVITKIMFFFVVITGISACMLRSTSVNAENDSVTDELNVIVPVSCSMSGNIDTAHMANLKNGTYSGTSGSVYENGIGQTTLTTFCNDQNGFSIYAVGFTNNTVGNTDLVGAAASNNATIPTGTNTSGSTSNWAMKINKVENPQSGSPIVYNPQNMTIKSDTEGLFSNFHTVPSEYTKVAEYHAETGSSATDTALGAKITTTYAAYVSPSQVADTYTGQVKYVMVHPYDGSAPVPPTVYTDPTIIYDGNGATDGSMAGFVTSFTSNDVLVDLMAPNFKKINYGFAGWSENENATVNSGSGRIFGPNEAVNVSDFSFNNVTHSTTLYAVWVPFSGNMQNYSCSSLSSGRVVALRDTRDNNVYTVSKMQDGNCWMMENLRLDNNNSSDSSKAQGFGGAFVGLADSEDNNYNTSVANSIYNTTNITDDNQIFRFPRYNNNNINIGGTNSFNENLIVAPGSWNGADWYDPHYSDGNNNDNSQWYGYGNYYTWAAAMANTDNLTTANASELADTSICPSGWSLPYGNNSGRGAMKGGFSYLDVQMDGTGNYRYDNEGEEIVSNVWRRFPNNFVYSGGWYENEARYRGSNGYYWSSTANGNNAYFLGFYYSYDGAGTDSISKRIGHSVRCLINN